MSERVFVCLRGAEGEVSLTWVSSFLWSRMVDGQLQFECHYEVLKG